MHHLLGLQNFEAENITKMTSQWCDFIAILPEEVSIIYQNIQY